ncbi:unnamed protein product [Clonostachys solani]|uniref:Uncharacterized protein n=1 Tax=Clonostachys solani TaxID=160281 RepID=A0A9N9ZIM4_9HYPO|nr:unnamed protein product [Clonostachys solani]
MVPGKRLDSSIYSVDYTAMMPHTTLIHSLRHNDFFVFAVSITSILLKLQLVFTSSLFQGHSITVTKPVQVDTLNDFATSEADMTTLNASTGPYYHAKALQGHETMYPFGVMPGGAYQTFQAQGVAGDERRGTVNAPLTVLVNGTFMDVECLELKNYTVLLNKTQQFTASLQFEGCDEVFTVRSVNPLWRLSRGGFWGTANIDTGKSCPSLPRQYASFLNYGILFQQIKETKNIEFVEKCAAILCSAKSWISKVRVVDDGILPIVSILEPSFRENTTAIPDPWDMIYETIPNNTEVSITHNSRDGQGALEDALHFRGSKLNEADKALYNSSVMKDAVRNLTQSIGPMIAHYRLRKPVKTQIDGSIDVVIDKLHLNQVSSVVLASIFALNAVSAIFAFIYVGKRRYDAERDPATNLGMMMFLRNNDEAIECLSQHRPGRKLEWARTTFTPIVLRVWARALFAFCGVGLIVSIMVTLGVSDSSDGLATIKQEIHVIMWVSLPTLSMLLVSIYISSVDTAVRSLAVLSKLSATPVSRWEMDMSLADMIGVRALYHSLRLRFFAISITQTLAISAAFLTTLASSLFTVIVLPEVITVEIPQQSWFGSKGSTGGQEWDLDRARISGLVLARRLSNITYPEHTYDTLVFQTLGHDDANWAANTSAQVRVPAARVAPSCNELMRNDLDLSIDSSRRIIININRNYSDYAPLEWVHPGEPLIPSSTQNDSQLFAGVYINNAPPDFDVWRVNKSREAWTIQDYVWGQYIPSKKAVTSVVAWRCNYSWVEVETDLRLQWVNGSIQIDHNNPPVQHNSTTKPWNPPFGFPPLGKRSSSRTAIPFPELFLELGVETFDFSPQFGSIMKPFGQIEIDDLGDIEKVDAILEALHANLGFVAAQLANVESRLRIDESSSQEPLNHDSLRPIDAQVTSNYRSRVIQDRGLTFALVGILSLLVLVNTLVLALTAFRRWRKEAPYWQLDMDFEGVAPDSFEAIAKMEALLHGSNALHDPRVLSGDQEQKEGPHFRMGWFQNVQGDSVFTIGVQQDEEFIFSTRKMRHH